MATKLLKNALLLFSYTEFLLFTNLGGVCEKTKKSWKSSLKEFHYCFQERLQGINRKK